MDEKEDKEEKTNEEEEVELYCADDSEEIIPEDQKNDAEKSSIDKEIEHLTSEISLQKKYELDLTTFYDETNFQNKVDILINQMKEISNYLNVKCGMIDKMNILMCIITFKIFDLQHDFKMKMNDLKEQKENIMLSRDDETIIPLEILNIDRMMRELHLRHHELSQGYKQQKVDLQIEYERITTIMDKQLEFMKRNLALLEEGHKNLIGEARKSEPLLIDYITKAAIEEFTSVIEKFELKQGKGWKSLYGNEKILDTLQSRGLAISQSGYILTESGDKMTYDEAEKKNLLHGLHFREKLFPKEVKENEDLVQTSSSVLTTEESEKESLVSQISSEDVSYLREMLGKPLTLALAEIIAKQPRDPIHYLGHWLFKYRYNQELDETQTIEYEALMAERNRLLKERLHRLYEQEARLLIFEMINNAENEAVRKELQRILREQVMGGEDEENDQASRDLLELKKLLNMIQSSTETH